MGHRALGELLRLAAGAFDPEDQRERRLAELGVLARRLAELVRGRREVEHVVRDLERLADVRAVGPVGTAPRRRHPRRHGPDLRRGGDQRAGLEGVDLEQRVGRQLVAAGH